MKSPVMHNIALLDRRLWKFFIITHFIRIHDWTSVAIILFIITIFFSFHLFSVFVSRFEVFSFHVGFFCWHWMVNFYTGQYHKHINFAASCFYSSKKSKWNILLYRIMNSIIKEYANKYIQRIMIARKMLLKIYAIKIMMFKIFYTLPFNAEKFINFIFNIKKICCIEYGMTGRECSLPKQMIIYGFLHHADKSHSFSFYYTALFCYTLPICTVLVLSFFFFKCS